MKISFITSGPVSLTNTLVLSVFFFVVVVVVVVIISPHKKDAVVQNV